VVKTLFVDFFIRRPVFATVCALLIILGGAICIPTLPIAQFPRLAPPQVVVRSGYIGANAETVESAVTIPLEQAINGVQGMKYITSASGNDGTSLITVTFDISRDVDLAAVDVQNRVNQAIGRLPNEVKNTGVVIGKQASGFVFGAGVYSENGQYDSLFLSNYLDIYVRDAIKRVAGVGDVIIFGERKYAMRLWLDPAKMAQHGLTATNILAALQEQNVQVAAGQVGQPPAANDQAFQISVRAIGRLTEAAEFDNIILKTGTDGTLVRVKDAGHAELGAEDYSSRLRFNGHEAVGVAVTQLPGANALDVDRAAKAEFLRLSKYFPPGLKYAVAFDTTTVVSESIRDVLITLLQAICLVIAVIFLFLQDWRSTFIPAITIPVSLVGTFIFVKLRRRRRHRGHRERRAAHRGGHYRAAQRRFGGHEGSGRGGGRDIVGAGGGVRPRGAFPGHHRYSVSPICTDNRVFRLDLGLQCPDADAGPFSDIPGASSGAGAGPLLRCI
jgi:hydrophobic/amphiphilic exporter-1 (mainly G- bacteria), HAE1 family